MAPIEAHSIAGNILGCEISDPARCTNLLDFSESFQGEDFLTPKAMVAKDPMIIEGCSVIKGFVTNPAFKL